MRGIILSGGFGTRLRPLTYTENKHLILIGGEPMLFHPIRTVIDAGISDIGIILGTNAPEAVVNVVGDGKKFGDSIKITHVKQGLPKGIAHAIGCAEDFVGNEPFVVHLGDNILRGGIKEFAEKFEKTGAAASILLTKVEDPQRFGVAEIENGKVVRLIEKPKEPKPNHLAIVGIYFFRKPVFDVIKKLKPSWRGELEITDAIQSLMDLGYNVDFNIIKREYWKDPGDPEGILDANQMVLEDLQSKNLGNIVGNVQLIGKISIEKDTVIKDSVIRGPVAIGKNCRITSAYIGPYTTIGDEVEIEGGEIESSVVMHGCVIKTNRRIVESLVGRNSKITSADRKPAGCRVVIGENSFVQL